MQNNIDAFHRKLLRRVIDIRWPRIISNVDLYAKVNTEKWSKTIQRRRLNWLGHMMRLDEQTPVRLSLTEALSDVHRKVGRPTLTWLKLIQKDLDLVNTNLNIDKTTPTEVINRLIKLTENRANWRGMIRDIMAVNC